MFSDLKKFSWCRKPERGVYCSNIKLITVATVSWNLYKPKIQILGDLIYQPCNYWTVYQRLYYTVLRTSRLLNTLFFFEGWQFNGAQFSFIQNDLNFITPFIFTYGTSVCMLSHDLFLNFKPFFQFYLKETLLQMINLF